MAIKLTEWHLPTLYGGHSGSGGATQWWNTVGFLSETVEGALPSVAYNGPQGSIFNGLTNWLHCQGFGLSVPEGSTVVKVRAMFRARATAGVVTVTRAALRVHRPETPYLSFPVDTELTPNLLLTKEWQDLTLEWDGARVNPSNLPSIPALVASNNFGFAIACVGQGGKVEVDVGKMQLELDDGKEEEEEAEDMPLDALNAVRDELAEVRTLLALAVPTIERADTAIGKADALISSLSETEAPA